MSAAEQVDFLLLTFGILRSMTETAVPDLIEDRIEDKNGELFSTFGLMMIKPHAYGEGADMAIADLLDGEYGPEDDRVKALRLSPETVKALFVDRKLHIVSRFYRTLNAKKDEALFDIFYGRDKGTRHYPTLLDRYSGQVGFLLLRYDGANEEYTKLARELKGKHSFQNGVLNPGTGIRGTFSPLRKVIDLDALRQAPDEEYKEKIGSVIDNVIHITDFPSETALAVKSLLLPGEIDDIENRGIPIQSFIDTHIHE